MASAIHASSVLPLSRSCRSTARRSAERSEGELFVYEKRVHWSHAGAPRLFEAANGGSVFLDSWASCRRGRKRSPAPDQERTVLRLGAERRAARVRFISATNRELEAEIARGNFRADL